MKFDSGRRTAKRLARKAAQSLLQLPVCRLSATHLPPSPPRLTLCESGFCAMCLGFQASPKLHLKSIGDLWHRLSCCRRFATFATTLLPPNALPFQPPPQVSCGHKKLQPMSRFFLRPSVLPPRTICIIFAQIIEFAFCQPRERLTLSLPPSPPLQDPLFLCR